MALLTSKAPCALYRLSIKIGTEDSVTKQVVRAQYHRKLAHAVLRSAEGKERTRALLRRAFTLLVLLSRALSKPRSGDWTI